MTNGYLRTMISGKSYWLHRLAVLYMTGEFSKEVDHANSIRTDNRWCNLRPCVKSNNAGNTGKRKNNTTGYKGVFKSANGWSVRIAGTYVGYSKDITKAAQMYDVAAKEHYGEFAMTNERLGLC